MTMVVHVDDDDDDDDDDDVAAADDDHDDMPATKGNLLRKHNSQTHRTFVQ